MFGLSSLVWKLIGSALALLAVFGFIYFSGVEAGKAKLRPDLNHYKDAARDYKAASRTWRGRYTAERSQRDADHQNAVAAVTAVESACSARVAAARKSEAAIHKLMATPVRVDAAGCPAPVIWRSDVLQASMRPGAR
jgi:hypothetical protein